jgi:uncharacterized integral membrane protein (TIGR00698 family)
MQVQSLAKPIFSILSILFLIPNSFYSQATTALATGIIFAIIFKNPYHEFATKASSRLLKISVIGLGFGLNLIEILEIELLIIFLACGSVLFTMCLGVLLSKLFKIDKITAYLITVGTAICGGSAIMAISSLLRNAKSHNISIAIALVFILNAVSLFVFPTIGKFLGLEQEVFGIFAAMAIHDMSSVVAASSIYGDKALEIAIILKICKFLMLFFVIFFTIYSFRDSRKQQVSKLPIPYFIIFFIIAILVNSFVPMLTDIAPLIVKISKHLFIVILFFIGSMISFKNIHLGKTLSYAVILWLTASITFMSLLLVIF